MANTKKTNFVTVTSVPSGSYQDLFKDGSNVKISYENFLAGLGVTGTIVQDGDPLATPVLDTQGTVNNIRNMENGPGVKFSVSPENGVTGEHNFAFDGVGAALCADPALSQPVFRSIRSGTGINATATGDEIQLSLTGTPVSTKTVVVAQTSDFPAASAGVITLAAETEYQIVNDVDIGTDRFVVSDGTVISGADSAVITLTYTGTGAMFTSTEMSWRVGRITLSCINGSVFDVTDAAGFSTAQLIDMTVSKCVTVGTVAGGGAIQLNNVAFPSISTFGIAFSGNVNAFICVLCIGLLDAGTFFDLGTATFNTISIESNLFNFSGGGTALISGLTASGNINASGFATLLNNRMVGLATPLTGVSVDDALWSFSLNDEIADTRSDALLSLQSNATATTIAVSGTPVLVAGTWVVESTSQMTGTTGGRATYDGDKDARLPVTASVTVEPASGGAADISVYIAVNGSVVTNSKRTGSASSGNPSSITAPWQLNFTSTDYVEVFVANDSSTVDILASSAILRVD